MQTYNAPLRDMRFALHELFADSPYARAAASERARWSRPGGVTLPTTMVEIRAGIKEAKSTMRTRPHAARTKDRPSVAATPNSIARSTRARP